MKNLICLLLVAFLATTTFAQRKGMSIKADAAVDRMTRELDLSTEQQVKIKAIYETKIVSKKSRNAQTKEEYQRARTDFNQKIDAVLTSEQIEKRQALIAEQKEILKIQRSERVMKDPVYTGDVYHARTRKGQNKGGKLGKMTPEMIEKRAEKQTEKLNKQVSLDEAQQANIKTAYLNFFQKNQEITTDPSLDAAAKKEMLTALKAKHRTELKSLLTEQQLAARKANKKVRKEKRQQEGQK